MKTSIRTFLTVFVVLFMGIMSLRAQTPETDLKETSWWEWFFGAILTEEFIQQDDFYEDIYQTIDLKGQWSFSIGDNERWLDPKYDDNNWEKIHVPGDWEGQGFNGYDGYGVYRMHFDGRLLKEGNTHFLVLGYIDDVDVTYLNGTMIGRSGQLPPRYRTAYNTNRKYLLPTEAINFEGDNVIAVRVFDDHLAGGIVGGDPGIYVTQGSEYLLQDLYGQWLFKKGHNPNYRDEDYDDSNWEKLVVPSYWDNQGYRSYDGIAWYRKTFNLEFELEEDKQYYLMLGKIDDFDITFLNGQEIGQTNDDKRYGSSESYSKLRTYAIPNGLLKPGSNFIAVKVTDMGNGGGIYKGPVGIVEQADLTKIYRNSY